MIAANTFPLGSSSRSRSWYPARQASACAPARRGAPSCYAQRVTSNWPFGRWGDDVVAAAMIDRLVRHAEVLILTGDSYRIRPRRELFAKGRAGN
jgi:hypothetical protein